MKRSLLPVLVLSLALTAAPLALASEARTQRGRYIVVLEDNTASPSRVAADHATRYGARVSHVYGTALKGYAASLTERAAARVALAPGVAWVEVDRVFHATDQALPTGVDRIEGDVGSQAAGDGSGSVSTPAIAIIDSGIDLDHPDLNVIAGVTCSGADPLRNRCAIGGEDDDGHGTHVAGTVAAKDNGEGVVGIAPGAPLVAVKVLKHGSGYVSWIVAGINWVAANAASRNIKVANMSLGGSGADDSNCGNTNNDAIHKAICNLVKNKGVTLVVAAGNSAQNLAKLVPAAYNEVLTVTAVADFDGRPGGGAASTCRSDVDDTAAFFSNWAVRVSDQKHTIAAPGMCILSTWVGGGVNTISGTSMATPHVAGTVALCLSSGTCSGTPAQIIAKLRADAAAADASNSYGFLEDPNSSPITGRFYGYLASAGGY